MRNFVFHRFLEKLPFSFIKQRKHIELSRPRSMSKLNLKSNRTNKTRTKQDRPDKDYLGQIRQRLHRTNRTMTKQDRQDKYYTGQRLHRTKNTQDRLEFVKYIYLIDIHQPKSMLDCY